MIWKGQNFHHNLTIQALLLQARIKAVAMEAMVVAIALIIER